MLLQFPNADTVRLALTGGIVPVDVSLASAEVSYDSDGRIVIESAAKLPRKATTELGRLGVVSTKRHIGEAQSVSCWLQVVPLERDVGTPQLASQAAVLFDLPSAEELASIVAEMLRLGNDRQSFRWIETDDANTPPRVLLRVIGPPYYTLLRALDHPRAVRAYVEQSPRVWLQLGYSHPLISQAKVAEGQLLLVGPPRQWSYLPDAPFRDVYDVLQFPLPSAPTAWRDSPIAETLTVPLKLVPGNATDVAELWVLRGAAIEQLDTFVRDTDERIAQRLKFAVGTDASGQQIIVLRTPPSKLSPPVLQFADAVAFKPFWKLPNLFIPVGTRLHPTLRRDVVRKLLADDTDQLVWLFPGANGAFTPEQLPEDAFRPLADWVEYVIETNHIPLSAWIDASRFDFAHFVCSESQPPKPKDDKGSGKGRKGKAVVTEDAAGSTTVTKPVVATTTDTGPRAVEFVQDSAVRPPSEWLIRRTELETKFTGIDGPLDDPQRLALWPELAIANTGTGDIAEAALCWANAMWEQPTPPAAWFEAWMRAELPDQPKAVFAVEFDKLMKPVDPSPTQMRQFAAGLLWVAHQSPTPSWFAPRLSATMRYLEANDRKLPARIVWLAAARLAQLAGADLLGQARVRDRLLQRLLDDGLRPEQELPNFLRFDGLKDADRARAVREKLRELHRLVRGWTEKGLKSSNLATESDGGMTLGYIDLLFAFGQAKLGESEAAKSLVESARQVFANGKPGESRSIASGFLFKAFGYRIEQLLASKPLSGRLEPALYTELNAIEELGKATFNSPNGNAHYAISRLREQSRILEPQEALHPYRKWTAEQQGDLVKTLTGLQKQHEPSILIRTIRDIFRSATDQPTKLLILSDSLPVAPRAGEAFTVELLGHVPDAFVTSGKKPVASAIVPDLKDQAKLLERALFFAAHFDRREVLERLIETFLNTVRSSADSQRYEMVNIVASRCLLSLRKLGLKDEIDKLLRRLQEIVLQRKTFDQLKTQFAAKPELWGKALQSLLAIAGGWLAYGLMEQAKPILDDARTALLTPGMWKVQPKDFTPVAQAYIAALGQGPTESGLARIEELFRKMPPERVTNGWTTAPCYSRYHLNLVEEVVLAVVSDDFANGASGKRWLEEDEYLIRRRIHRDMKRHLDGSGL